MAPCSSHGDRVESGASQYPLAPGFLSKQPCHLSRVHRMREMKSLDRVAATVLQEIELTLRFDTLGHDFQGRRYRYRA